MNDGLKQRLIGAVVLSCIALILWPVIFSDVSNPIVDRRSQIPPVPAFEKYEVAKPVRSKNIEPAIMAQQSGNNLAANDAKKKDQNDSSSAGKPVLDARGLPESWVIQVASFSKKGNAEELKLALQKKGLKSYTRDILTAGGTSTRVFVGPKLTRKALQKDKVMIDKTFLLKSIIVPFKA